MVLRHVTVPALGRDTPTIMTDQVYGQQGTSTTDDDYNTLSFVFWLLMQKVQTNTLVKVISCTNSGGLSPVGTVTVQPCVNQMTGARQAVAHGPIYNCLYSRVSGGRNAVILDPEEGDLGMMAFCSRDISGVVANQGPANPGSFRMFDWADGIFTANVPLGITPEQYLQFSAGITAGTPVLQTTQNLSAGTGANGTFTTPTGQTVTVQNGIIVNIA